MLSLLQIRDRTDAVPEKTRGEETLDAAVSNPFSFFPSSAF